MNSNIKIISENIDTETNNKKSSKKGSKKYIYSDEKKAQYLETYKNKPCYNLKIKCLLCNCEYLKACEQTHFKARKHILNNKAYEQTLNQIKELNINNDDEKLKLFEENKIKIAYVEYLETLKNKKPSIYEGFKLFV